MPCDVEISYHMSCSNERESGKCKLGSAGRLNGRDGREGSETVDGTTCRMSKGGIRPENGIVGTIGIE